MEWISVKDDLPELDKDVLVFDEWKTQEGEIRKDYRISSLTSITSRRTSDGLVEDCEWYGEFNFNITHWMPLPEPPKDAL